MAESVQRFSQEWCDQACGVWDDTVVPNLVDSDGFNWVVEFKALDTEAICQASTERGKVLNWTEGKSVPDEDCGFILHANSDIWQKIGAGELDPVGAVASQRLHLKKGSMTVVIRESNAFKKLLIGFGGIPTA